MSNILAIAQKELRSYFASPIAYILMAFFGLIFGFGFYTATRDMVRFSFQAQMMGQQQPMNVNDQIIRPLLGFAASPADTSPWVTLNPQPLPPKARRKT